MTLTGPTYHHTHTQTYTLIYAILCIEMYRSVCVVTTSQRINQPFRCSHSVGQALAHVHCLTFSLVLTFIVFSVHNENEVGGRVNVSSLALYLLDRSDQATERITKEVIIIRHSSMLDCILRLNYITFHFFSLSRISFPNHSDGSAQLVIYHTVYINMC